MTDYFKILKFYINHVGTSEGTTFLYGDAQFDELTAEENAELNRAYHESAAEWVAARNARVA
jgi:hypothetical protein